MKKVVIRKIGNSDGIILPKEILLHLHVQEGDELFITETPSGLEITPYDPDFEKQLESAENIMRRYKNTLRELAK